jgi:hypothetical protein
VATYPIEIASHSFAITAMKSSRLNATWYKNTTRCGFSLASLLNDRVLDGLTERCVAKQQCAETAGESSFLLLILGNVLKISGLRSLACF